MRLLEILILIINLPFIFHLFFPKNQVAIWVRLLPVTGVVIILVHLFVEGYRWQMFSAYLLSAFFLLLVLINYFSKSKPQIIQNKILSVAIGTLAIVFLCSSAVLGTLLPVFKLPQPTGTYLVGTVSYHWIDESRDELLTDDHNDKREIMVQIWYPAAETDNPQSNYYWQDYGEAMGPSLARDQRLPKFLFSHFDCVKTNAMLDAPLSDKLMTYPVVIYSHGAGCGRSWATFQMEELASNGYIVISYDITYDAMATLFPDGRIIYPISFSGPMIPWDSLPDSTKIGIKDGRIRFGTAIRLPNSVSFFDSVSFTDRELLNIAYEERVSDIAFIINRLDDLNRINSNSKFSTHINMEMIGVMGFSNGGGYAKEISRRDHRIKALITQDASTPGKTDYQQPILCLLSEYTKQGFNPKMDHIIHYKECYSGEKINVDFVLIKGTYHNNFIDSPLFTPLKQSAEAGPIDVEYAQHIINTFTVAFYDKYLKGEENISIASVAKSFPEVYVDSISAKD